ncbi:MAG: hypothetical protein HZA04_10035 [Nitrospinae bacterium]|nr:hypothetical protein [Nitrospinota bacterium]
MKRFAWCAVLFILLGAGSAFAGDKEKIVLLPVSGPLTAAEKGQLEKKLAAGLGKRYAVIAGPQVEEALRKALQEENQKAICDLEGCYVKIAGQFKAELIAAFLLAPRMDGSINVTFRVMNVVENREVYSRSADCAACTVSKLIGLGESLLQGMDKK